MRNTKNTLYKGLIASLILLVTTGAYAESAPIDSVIPNYTAQMTASNKKTVTIINNSNKTIYPVLRQATSKEYRLYVGQKGHGSFTPGLLPGQKADVTVPAAMDNAGRILICTAPVKTSQNSSTPSETALDTNPKSSNDGDLAYSNATPLGVPFDSPCQLAEYTFNANTVDYDVSYVDEMYLPLALETGSGTVGYMGNGMTVQAMQTQIKAFTDGSEGVYWPHYYIPNNPYIKIPSGYNIYADQNFMSTYDQHKKMLVSDMPVAKGFKTGYQSFLANQIAKWQSWLPGGANAKSCGSDKTCQAFASNVNFIMSTVKASPYNKPSLQANVEDIIGYSPYPAKFDQGDTYCSPYDLNCFRDTVKSLLRSVPYPFTTNSNWYAAPTSKYNLDPMVWFVHKKLGMAGYGFSIDDDTGNVEVGGSNVTIAVGGLNGLYNKSQYNPQGQQSVNFAPGWQSVSSAALGQCNLLHNTGTPCDIGLNPQARSTAAITLNAKDGAMQFNLAYGQKLKAGGYALKMTSCKVTGKLSASLCSATIMHVDPTKPNELDVPAPSTTGGGGHHSGGSGNVQIITGGQTLAVVGSQSMMGFIKPHQVTAVIADAKLKQQNYPAHQGGINVTVPGSISFYQIDPSSGKQDMCTLSLNSQGGIATRTCSNGVAFVQYNGNTVDLP